MPICPSCHSIYEMKEDHCPKWGEPKPERYHPLEEPVETQPRADRRRWLISESDNWRCGMFYIVCMYYVLVIEAFGIAGVVLQILIQLWKGEILAVILLMVLVLPFSIGVFMVTYMAVLFAKNE